METDLKSTIETRLVDIILEELNFYPENLDEGSITDTDIYKFILKKVSLSGCILNNEKLLAIKSLSCQLYREDNHGGAEFEKDTIFDLLADRNERDYIELFRYYYSLIPNLEIHTIHNVQLIIGTNFKLELNLFLSILSETITKDLNIALEKVRKVLIESVIPEEWYELLGGEDCDDDEKKRLDQIINSVVGGRE